MHEKKKRVFVRIPEYACGVKCIKLKILFQLFIEVTSCDLSFKCFTTGALKCFFSQLMQLRICFLSLLFLNAKHSFNWNASTNACPMCTHYHGLCGLLGCSHLCHSYKPDYTTFTPEKMVTEQNFSISTIHLVGLSD